MGVKRDLDFFFPTETTTSELGSDDDENLNQNHHQPISKKTKIMGQVILADELDTYELDVETLVVNSFDHQYDDREDDRKDDKPDVLSLQNNYIKEQMDSASSKNIIPFEADDEESCSSEDGFDDADFDHLFESNEEENEFEEVHEPSDSYICYCGKRVEACICRFV
ncbi:hypothetical protein FDP41_008672 [Naegleria fowleri]|uniref:Uncharacterized protein n=1 Tax=Naegleria fowleri TaxID=5763 RepID=A0A6A5BGA3_NAEFO|nr:uncharacterized protein FDP41_008672 [Naegleria fowleri]KAF0973008.1 hypothetical protein FDP41_008672 [Naegleria fowleri]